MNLKRLSLGSNGLTGWKWQRDGPRLHEELQRRVWAHIAARRTAQGLEAGAAKAQAARLDRIMALRKEAAQLKAEARALTTKARALTKEADALHKQADALGRGK